MPPTYVPFKRIAAKAVVQMQGIHDHPELGKRLPGPAEEVASLLAKVNSAAAARERLRGALRLAVDRLQQTAFELRGKLNANVAIVAKLSGAGSPDVIAVGGKPRKARRVPAPPAP